MAKEVVPNKQNIEETLKNRVYYIDFYQREYVWSKDTAITLLNDIFYAFELGYNEHKESEISPQVIEKYNWYYLNVYITNKIDSKTYIVDGQQRLTTLTLIALKLYHLVEDNQIKEALKPCVFSSDSFGSRFNIDNDKRKEVMQALLDNKEYAKNCNNDTEKNLVERYKDISKYLEANLNEDKKLKSFCHYFLLKLVLVELDISQDDTPMVFEVINDRGERLKPFEILKGKLIGALNKDDVETFCKIWQDAIHRLEGIDIDAFFSDYLKSKFIFTRNSDKEKQINNFYHRYIFKSNEIADKLELRKSDSNQKKNIKNFIKQDVDYYSKLYAKIFHSQNEFLRYCEDIHDLDGQYRLIMAACEINDKQEDEKIELIAKEYEKLWVLLNLNGIYDSNRFQELTYNLQKKLSQEMTSKYKEIFNNTLCESIKEENNLDRVDSVLSISTFSERAYNKNNTKFLRYLFARVEKYICDNIKQTPQHDVFYISTKTGDVNGYHIEHILSRNNTNIAYFESEKEFDIQRNKLGGLLLLQDRKNISSGNEEYKDKLKTYSHSLVWGHTLCEDFYHSHPNFKDFNDTLKSQFKSYDKFDKNTLQERTELLYELIKNIWEVK